MDTIVYGRNAVLELLSASPEKVEKVYFQFNTSHPKLKEILIRAKRLRIPVGKARLEKLGEIAGTTKHQGVCALVTSKTYSPLEEVLDAPRNSNPLLVILPGLNDPHNIGAIIRTAEAVAADAVVIVEGKGSPLNAAVHKASAGALSHIRVSKVRNLARTLAYLKEKGFQVVAAEMQAEVNYTAVDFTRPTALVMGSEGKGLPPDALRECGTFVRIPIAGCVESLNVSVSAGVLLYEAMRQRLG